MQEAPLRTWPFPREAAIPLLLFLGGIAYLWGDVDRVSFLIFDEHYYVGVARHALEGSLVDPQWGASDPRPWNFEHPPLAKFLMAGSIELLGDKPAGWRLPSVLAGALGYAGAYMLARNAFRSTVAGLAAAAFLAMDPLYYIHARLAILEVFPAAFLAWSAALVLDPRGPRLVGAGLMLGLAVACKYSALFLGPPILLLALLRSAGNPWGPRLRQAGIGLLLVPGLVVLASYLPYLWVWTRDHGVVFAVKELVWVQSQMFVYGQGAVLTHQYQSGVFEWFLLTVPVYYFYIDPPGPLIGWIYSVGNPVSWWSGLVAMVAGSVGAFWRGLRAAEVSKGFPAILTLFVLGLLPFLFVSRILLNFYAAVYTPLLAVAAAGIAARLWRNAGWGPSVAILYGSLVAAAWLVYYPLASGVPIDQEQVRWIFSLVPWMKRYPVPGAYEP